MRTAALLSLPPQMQDIHKLKREFPLFLAVFERCADEQLGALRAFLGNSIPLEYLSGAGVAAAGSATPFLRRAKDLTEGFVRAKVCHEKCAMDWTGVGWAVRAYLPQLACGKGLGVHVRLVCRKDVGTAGVWLCVAIEAALLLQPVCQKGRTRGGCVGRVWGLLVCGFVWP